MMIVKIVIRIDIVHTCIYYTHQSRYWHEHVFVMDTNIIIFVFPVFIYYRSSGHIFAPLIIIY